MTFYGLLENPVMIPAFAQTRVGRLLINAVFQARLNNKHSFSINRDIPIAAHVSGLLDKGCPTAVPRLIVPVIIDAINGVALGRSLPHIREKVLKAIKPTVANLDTSVDVVSMIGSIRVGATPSHFYPSTVSRGLTHPMGRRSNLARRVHPLDCLAAAALRVSPLKVLLVNLLDYAARAAAKPLVASLEFQNSPVAVSCFHNDVYYSMERK